LKIISLTRGKAALVDDSNHGRLSEFKWFAVCNNTRHIWYAIRFKQIAGRRKGYYMHREILGLTNPILRGDHKDGNGLNNQENNLRIATPGQNMANRRKRVRGSSKFKGVTWFKRQSEWRASIQVRRRYIYIGAFDMEEDAARAYDKAAQRHFGEFAFLNFPINKIDI